MGKINFAQKAPVWLGLILLGCVTLSTVPKDMSDYPISWKLAETAVITGGLLSLLSGGAIAIHLLINEDEEADKNGR